MPDLLVNLLTLPSPDETIKRLHTEGVTFRRALPHEMSHVREFIRREFGNAWSVETLAAYANKPVSMYIAIREGRVIGFGAYECTARAFFGPTGVKESERKKGIGVALLLLSLQGMREMGYVYGIIGSAGPVDFYRQAVGAVEIEGSEPGIYATPLSYDENE